MTVSGLLGGCATGISASSGSTPTTPAPALSSISPTRLNAGSAATTLTVSGSGFTSTSTVVAGSTPEATTYVSASQLTAIVPAGQLVNGVQLPIVVTNGGTNNSAALNLEVDNPVPTIGSLSTTTAVAGTASAVVTVTGTGFVPSSVINVNASARSTTYINATQVSAALPSTDFLAAGTLSFTAVNPAPAGGTSAAASLGVINPAVGALKLTPSTLNKGTATAATITVTGTGFVPASVVTMSGTARATTYVNGTTLTFAATVADQATVATLPVTVTNAAPGGGTSPIAALSIVTPPATPVITSITPTSVIAGSGSTIVTLFGTNFTSTSIAQWNGTSLPTTFGTYYTGTGYTTALNATVPTADLVTAGTATLTVNTPNASPSLSNGVTLTIANPPAPTLTSLYPAGGPIGVASAETLNGTGFTLNSTVAVNGVTIPSTFVSSTQLTANFPAQAVATPGNEAVTVTTPAPGGGTTAAQLYTTYLSIANNDIVYNAADGLIYASVPVSAAGKGGNAVVAIDPNTGSITRTIQVGTNPNKLSLSSDGTQLFVGIDGAGAVAQVNLAQGTIVNQFSLGGGAGIYNPPSTAAYLAAVPGLPNSVAVAVTGQFGSGAITIFDSGVARTGNTVSGLGTGPLSFGSSASTLYLGSTNIAALTVTSTGITAATKLSTVSNAPTWIQYDNGSLYLSTGQVLNASSGALKGTFYSSGTTTAYGPIVSDSTLGRAFMGLSSFNQNGNAVYVFSESDFSLVGSIPVNGLGTQGYPTTFRKIVRWGQNGLAVSAVPSAFTTNNQIYIFQSSLVKDVSSSPADLSVALSAPATATTGAALSVTATVKNSGPNPAVGVTFSAALDASLIINSITASQGTCSTAALFSCNLGGLANGASATITASVTPTKAATLPTTASVTSSSYDPTVSNNQATASTTATGSLYGAVPAITSISPNLVQAGAADFVLTVNGTGFSSASNINLDTTALTTTYVSATQLTATVTASTIATYGWAAVTVTNPMPGGGVSPIVPLTIYALVNVPANAIVYDPYGQAVYASVPSTATAVTANSLVAINPFSGVVGTPVPIGSQPTVMAETTDGNYLYIGLSGANSLAQFNLLSQSLTATIPIVYQSTGSSATSLATIPGSDTALAMGFTNTWGNFGIFDVNGKTGTFRPNMSGIYSGVNPVAASPTELYAYDSQTSGAEFYRYGINDNGLTLKDGTTLTGMGGFSGTFQLVNGVVYGAAGGIVNPNTTPPSQIQTLPLIDLYGSGSAGSSAGAVADPSLGKEFIMLENLAGTSAYGLVRYDLNSYLPETFLTLPTSLSGSESIFTMKRFGPDGIAMLSYNSFGLTAPVIQLLLLRGPFVAPQQLVASTAASLSSAPAIAHGSGNTMLTLTGSNFQPGVAVTWNGAYRTTTIVDSTHVTLAIPASDLAAAGGATVVATNPGAPASGSLQVTIN